MKGFSGWPTGRPCGRVPRTRRQAFGSENRVRKASYFTNMALLHIRVQPKASRNEIASSSEDGALRVRVTAPPEGGKANTVVLKLLAKHLKLAPSALEIVRGQSSRNKTIEIAELTDVELRQRL